MILLFSKCRSIKATAKFGASNATAVQSYINAHGSNGDLYKYWTSTGKNNLSKYYYSAFKTGGLADYTGFAWMDGTPNKPELVLNAQDTDNFLHLRDVLREMSQQELTMAGQPLNVSTYGVDISPQLRSVTDVSRILSELQNNPVSQNVEYTFGDTNINIDHVQDYNDFVRQLQNDKKFDDMIVGMTIGRINGGSSLAKYKYKFGK